MLKVAPAQVPACRPWDESLRIAGIDLISLESGRDPKGLLASENPDAVLVDESLPYAQKIESIRRIRPNYSGHVIVLSSQTDEVEQIVCIEAGADDYLVCPVSPKLLLARMAALQRSSARLEKHHVPGVARINGRVSLAPLSRVFFVDEQPLKLTPLEFELLALLVDRVGEVVDRASFERYFRRPSSIGRSRCGLDILVSRVRARLEDMNNCPLKIRTIYGKGYLLELAD